MAWMAIIMLSHLELRPRQVTTAAAHHRRGRRHHLCFAVATPFAVGARYAYATRDFITHVFPQNPRQQDHPEERDATRNPWAGQTRVNILLLGGDGGVDRQGVRTDSMIVASIDTTTGDTVLFSLPRNLQNAPFPPGSALAKLYPNGFNGPGRRGQLAAERRLPDGAAAAPGHPRCRPTTRVPMR